MHVSAPTGIVANAQRRAAASMSVGPAGRSVGESAAHRRPRAAVRTGAGRIILVGSIIQRTGGLDYG